MKKYSLIIGDILALLVITLIGFISHGEAKLSFILRFFVLFIPLVTFWLFLAPRYKLYQSNITTDLRQLWRVPLVMIFVSLMAVSGRNALLIFLDSFQPSDGSLIFIPILGITSTIGLCIWRALYFFLSRKS